MAIDPNDFSVGDTPLLVAKKTLSRLKEIIEAPAPEGASTESTLSELVEITPLSNPFAHGSYFGTVDGKTAKVFHIKGRRAGFNSTSTLQDVAEFLGTTVDLMPELTGAESLEVVSTSAADSAAGTGTRTVKITYLDGSNNMVQSEAITLNGTTPVALGFTAKFIYGMEAASGGSSETSVGNVILRIAGGGAAQEQISAGENSSLSCRFIVPSGYTAYVSDWQISSIGGQTMDVKLRATVNPFDRSLALRYAVQDTGFISTNSLNSPIPWLKFPALSKIKVSVIPSNADTGTRINTDFSILLVAT